MQKKVKRSVPGSVPSPIVLTIGHSTRTFEEFIRLLQAHGATYVMDVRTIPRSRHNPQFNKASLPRSLLMCAEALPWRCHRSLIADALVVRGMRTEHIMSATRRQVHALTPFASVRGTAITYPTEGLRHTQKKPAAKRQRPLPVAKMIPKEG